MIDASFEAPKRLLQFTAFFRQCFTKRSYASLVFYLSGMLLEHRRLSIQSVAAKEDRASIAVSVACGRRLHKLINAFRGQLRPAVLRHQARIIRHWQFRHTVGRVLCLLCRYDYVRWDEERNPDG